MVAAAVTRRVESRLDLIGTLRAGREVTVRSEAGGTVLEQRRSQQLVQREINALLRTVPDLREVAFDISPWALAGAERMCSW